MTRRFLAVTVACVGACVGACAHPPNATPAAHPTTIPSRAVRVAVPGARLHAAARTPAAARLLVPAAWVEEQPALDDVWPATPAYALEEDWIPSARTVCRKASWTGAIGELTPSPNRWFVDLRTRLAGDDRVRHANVERDGVRMTLVQERSCIYHDCRPPLSDPMTTLSVCVDGLSSTSVVGATRALMSLVPSTAPLTEILAFDGIRDETARYVRTGDGRAEVDVSFSATPAGRTRVREWLIARGFAVPVSSPAWALDSTDPSRTFVFSPPSDGETVVSVQGR